MGRFIKGEVVILPFPFTDLTKSKRRPAFVVSALEGDDLILCQITSQEIKDSYAIALSNDEFETGSLSKDSNIRPNRIFTADRNIILYSVGKVKTHKIDDVLNSIIKILRN